MASQATGAAAPLLMTLVTATLPSTQIACSGGDVAEADEARRKVPPDRVDSRLRLDTGGRRRPDKARTCWTCHEPGIRRVHDGDRVVDVVGFQA
jgi:hypothetical protein